MARPRSFDTDAAVEQAMQLFWRRGYVATSMSDVYEATGLGAGSLYAAFGGKEGLFRRAFERYAERFRATLPRGLRGLAAVEAWLRTQAELAAGDERRAGCLIVNTVAEREAHSPATQALAQGRMREIRDFFARQLLLAAEDGELPRDLDVDLEADALVGAVVALMTLGRAGADRATIENVARAAVRSIRDRSIKKNC